MNKKHIIIIIFLSVVVLILGLILIRQRGNTMLVKESEAFLKNEIENQELRILKMGDFIEKADKNFIEKADKNFNDTYSYIPFSHPRMLYRIYNDALNVLDFTKKIEAEINQDIDIDTRKIIDFAEDNNLYINKSLMSIIKSLNSPNYSSWEKQYVLLLIKNHLLQKCISQFDESIPLAYGQVINYAERDTVNFGEIYQSQILFNAIDATGNIIVFENGDTLKYGNFEEKAMKRGPNKKRGYMQISHNNGGTIFYEVKIDYFVK